MIVNRSRYFNDCESLLEGEDRPDMFFRSVVGTNDVLTVVVLDFDAIEADSEEVIDISFFVF